MFRPIIKLVLEAYSLFNYTLFDIKLTVKRISRVVHSEEFQMIRANTFTQLCESSVKLRELS